VIKQIDNEHHKSRFLAYDVLENKTRELFTLPSSEVGDYWYVSPDGSRIAYLQPDRLHNSSVKIRALNGKIESEFRVKGWSELKCINWAADGKTFFIGGVMPKGATLLRSDFKGHAQVLWSNSGASRIWAIPSPDGKYIAIYDELYEQNVWMVEGF
jgi:hypothetical protein